MALLFVNDRDLLLTGLQADYLCSIHSVLDILFSLSPKHTFREHQIIVHLKSGINFTVIPAHVCWCLIMSFKFVFAGLSFVKMSICIYKKIDFQLTDHKPLYN